MFCNLAEIDVCEEVTALMGSDTTVDVRAQSSRRDERPAIS